MRGRRTNYLPYLNDAGVSCSIWTDSVRRPALVTRRRNTREVRYTCRERRYPMSSCCCFNNSIAYLLLHRRLVRSNASSPPPRMCCAVPTPPVYTAAPSRTTSCQVDQAKEQTYGGFLSFWERLDYCEDLPLFLLLWSHHQHTRYSTRL